MTNARAESYTYTAITVQQQPDSPPMYVLGVAADELLEWADVPSAKADYMAGYQRVYSQERATSISEFLSLSPKNIIPGAIIVTVDSRSVAIEQSSVDADRITISVVPKEFAESLREISDQFRSRLSNAELDSVNLSVDPAAQDDSQDDADSGIPDSYLASLAAELRQAIDDFEGLALDRRMAIKNYVESVSKPGLIIDGQHRVFGAKDVTQHRVILPVVLLPGLDFAEQVFHFYVLNNKAKPLSPTELRRTISTSLTNQEIDSLWARFEDAGVNPEATRWTHKIHTDPASPFVGLIDFGLGGGGFLKENVAYQLVSKFVNMPRKYRVLHRDVAAFVNKDDSRLDYFYTVWRAVRDRFINVWNEGVSHGGNQLFQKAGLLVLQEYILDQLIQVTNLRKMEGRDSPFVDFEDLHKMALGILESIPPEFFSVEWQVKQIDTSQGRAFLRAQIDMTVSNQGRFLGNQQLFKKS